MFCPFCGKEIDEENPTFCPFCGEDLEPDDSPEPPKTTNKHNLEAVVALIAVFLSIFFIIMTILQFTNSNTYYHSSDYSSLPDLFLSLVSLVFGIIGAWTVRNHSKIGAVFLIIAAFFIGISKVNLAIFSVILYMISAVSGFIRN